MDGTTDSELVTWGPRIVRTGCDIGPGTTVGRYRIRRRLGAGGLGIVFEAFDPVLERVVALKFLHARFHDSAEELAHFATEARLAGRVAHGNVAALYDYGQSAAGPYLVCEYVPGMSLLGYMQAGPLTPLDACRLMVQTARGLAAVHGEGLVHRDIKPSNLIVTPEGVLKIVDFGLACPMGYRPPSTSRIIEGTPAFVSPEQVVGEAVDHRSDQYSLGATLYGLLTLELPFSGKDAFAVALARLAHRPRAMAERNVDVPPCVDAVVGKLMARRPVDRYADDEAVVAALQGIVACLSSSGMAVPAPCRCLSACVYRLRMAA